MDYYKKVQNTGCLWESISRRLIWGGNQA